MGYCARWIIKWIVLKIKMYACIDKKEEHLHLSVFRIFCSSPKHSVIKRSFWGHPTFVCLGFCAVSTVFQLFNGNSSQSHVSLTIFNQYLTSPLFWHWQASRSAVPIILGAKGESHYYHGHPMSVVNIYLVDTLEATFLGQLTWNLVRMYVLIMCLMSSNWGTWVHKLGH